MLFFLLGDEDVSAMYELSTLRQIAADLSGKSTFYARRRERGGGV